MQGYRAPPSFLRVIFPPPGFFLNDPTCALDVSGRCVVRGSFRQGFDWWAEVWPGVYPLDVRIETPLVSRSKTYTVSVQQGLVTRVELSYSRMWGNFTDAPRVTFVAPTPGAR